MDTNCHNPEFSRKCPSETWGEICNFEEHIDLMLLPIEQMGNQWLMELKNNRIIQSRLSELENNYDVIFIDTSAINNINRGNLPAERMLSHCDGSYLVVKAGETKRTEIIHAMSVIQSAELTLIGTVYNDVNNPSLARELVRETYRINRWLPGVAEWLRIRIQRSYLLNIML